MDLKFGAVVGLMAIFAGGTLGMFSLEPPSLATHPARKEPKLTTIKNSACTPENLIGSLKKDSVFRVTGNTVEYFRQASTSGECRPFAPSVSTVEKIEQEAAEMSAALDAASEELDRAGYEIEDADEPSPSTNPSDAQLDRMWEITQQQGGGPDFSVRDHKIEAYRLNSPQSPCTKANSIDGDFFETVSGKIYRITDDICVLVGERN